MKKYFETCACEVCNILISGKTLCIDHSHSSNMIRGILCKNCNSAVGHFMDSPKIINSAIEYIKIFCITSHI